MKNNLLMKEPEAELKFARETRANAEVCQKNHTNNTFYGFEFWDDCGGNDNTFRENDIGLANIGLYLNGNGIMGRQTLTANRWLGYNNANTYYPGKGAVNKNANTPQEIYQSQFKVHIPSPPNIYHPINEAQLNVTDWFVWLPAPAGFKIDGATWLNQNITWIYDPALSNDYDPQPSASFVIPPPGDLHNCYTPPPINDGERARMFGSAIGDSTETDGYDTLEFVIVDKETFFKSAIANPTILALGANNDAKYIAEYDSLKQTNMGAINEVVDSINKGKNTYALNKLNLIVDQNLIEYNKKYLATLVALNYDASLDADSDTIANVFNIALMHPFYGGEAVYWARAILHLNIIDEMPTQRKGKNVKNDAMQNTIIAKGTLYPNPANNEINFIFKHEKTDEVKLVIYDICGSIIISQVMLSEKQVLNVSDYVQSIYCMHVYVNGIDSEVYRFTVIK